MTLEVLYFAWIREHMGCAGETLTPPATVKTASDLIHYLAARDTAGATAFANPERVRIGVDQMHASADTDITKAREVAFFPPVTGG